MRMHVKNYRNPLLLFIFNDLTIAANYRKPSQPSQFLWVWRRQATIYWGYGETDTRAYQPHPRISGIAFACGGAPFGRYLTLQPR